MLVIAGTIAFESKHFVSVVVGARRDERNNVFRMSLSVRLDDGKELSATSDNEEDIQGMYLSILRQLTWTRHKSPDALLDEATVKAGELMGEIDVANQKLAEMNQSKKSQQPPPDESTHPAPTPKTEGE